MGLVAHYKLDGNADDALGKYHGTPSNVSWVDGKLGQCGSFTRGAGNGIYIPHDPALSRDVFGKKLNFSFAFWARPNTLTNYGIVVGKQSGSSFSSSTSSVWSHGGNRISMYLGTNEPNNPSGSRSFVDTFPTLGVWSHFAFTVQDGLMRSYLNGTLTEEKASTLTRERTENTQPIQIGTPRVPTGNEGFDGLLDDVRIYDHALSEREVRDLAKGLVLHYDFDQFQEPTENVFTNSVFSGTTGWSSTQGSITAIGDGVLSLRRSVSGTGDFQLAQVIPFSAGQVTAISFKCKKVEGTGAGTNSFGFGVGVWGMTPSWNMTRVSTEDVGDGWYKLTYVLPAATNSSGGATTGIHSMTNNLVDTYHIKEIQYERKSYATPFVNGARQGTVRDSSTQGNDAPLALATTPRWVEGGVIGKGCYDFSEPNHKLEVPDTPENYRGGFTLSAWIYRRSNGPGNFGRVFDKTTVTASTDGFFMYCNGSALAFQVHNAPIMSTATLTSNRWYFVAVSVSASGQAALYVDGTVVQTLAGITLTAITNNNPLTIGNRSGAFDRSFDGLIDDVHVYATTLSADEVKELYQQRASLDSRGNLIC